MNSLQHTRWKHWAQRWAALCALAVLLAGLCTGLNTGAALAQEDYPGGFSLMPVNPGTVRLLSMTVDASFRDDGEQVFVDVQAVYRVHNRDKGSAHTLTVAFPGYAVDAPLPEQVSLTAGRRQVSFSAARTQWWLAEVVVNADERLSLVLTYRLPLGDAPFLRFRYPMDLTARVWPDRLESARFTIGFTEPPNPQSWLALTPETYKLTAEAITWSYDAVDPNAAIEYVFMRPTLWQRLAAARHAAVSPDADSSAHVALGDVYAELAAAPGDASLFERYFPLAVAAYSRAQTLEPDNANAYLALARLYRTRAELSTPPDPNYISLAVSQLASALEHGAQAPGIAEAVAQDFAMLIARARVQGDFDTANAYLRRLESLATASRAPLESAALAHERRQLAIDWATSVLRDQGPGPARAVLIESFGPEAVLPPAARFARLNSLYVEVETQLRPPAQAGGAPSGWRQMRITAVPRPGGDALIAALAAGLQSTSAAEVRLNEPQPAMILVDIPFDSAETLRQRQAQLAAAVPAEPEWAMLAALLQPSRLRWQSDRESWRTLESYEEDVSLVAAVAGLVANAGALDQAAGALNPADALDALRAELWRGEAEVWRRLALNNRVRFDLTLYPSPGAAVVRTWSLDPGDQVTMMASATQYHVLPFLLAAAALYGLFLFLSWSLWWLPARLRARGVEGVE